MNRMKSICPHTTRDVLTSTCVGRRIDIPGSFGSHAKSFHLPRSIGQVDLTLLAVYNQVVLELTSLCFNKIELSKYILTLEMIYITLYEFI